MITPQVKDTKVVFGPCRLSYTHVFNKYAPDGDTSNGKYMTNVLIPKDEKETVDAIKKAIEAAKKAATVSKWGGKEPKKLDMPFNTIDGSTLVNRSGTLCVNTTDNAEQDNTRPITSSGVHVICGNINALLQAI